MTETRDHKNESGRSMVEMLGVLAIVGVLSIGGVAGYQSAVNQGRANAIVDDVNYLHLMSMSQRQNQTAWTPADFKTETIYPMTIQVGEKKCGEREKRCLREVSITTVPAAVCLRLKGMSSGFTGDCAAAENTVIVGIDGTGHFAEIKE